MVSRFVALVLCVALLPIGARAAEAEKAATQTPYLVLIGISSYGDKQILPRVHAEADVKALYDLLTTKGHFGADADHTKLLLGTADAKRKSEPATRANILKTLEWLSKNAKPGDPVVFAFFGSGGPRGKDDRCYFASDSTVKNRDKDAISAEEIATEFKKLESKHVCVFLDVNFKAIKGDKPPEVSLGENPFGEFTNPDKTPEATPKPGRVLFLATNGLTAGIDLKEQGLFAQGVLTGLAGKADKAGYEADGVITTEELAKWLDKELPRLRREKAAESRRVAHFVIGTSENRFVLAGNPKARETVTKQVAKLTALGKDKKLSEPLTREGVALLKRMPVREARQNLRKEYQALAAGKLTVEELETKRTKILDSMKLSDEDAGNFAAKVFEAAQMANQAYYREVATGTLVTNAIRGMYRRMNVTIPKDVADELAIADKLSDKELTKLLAGARQYLGKRKDLAEHKDLDIALARMLSPLDPHSTYVGPADKARFDASLKADFVGIGAQIRKDETTDCVKIITPIRNGPAFKAGIKAGDLIEKVTNEYDGDNVKLLKPESFEMPSLTLPEVVQKLMGKLGTKVKLTLRRPGKDKTFDVEITRGRVTVETVVGHKRDADQAWDFMLDADKKIGYIRLTQFAPNSGRDLQAAVEKLQKQGMKALILDVRFNGGGHLGVAREIADLFIDDQLIVSIRPRVGRPFRMTGKKEGSLTDFPMVCLVNGNSASASEIISACFQDHNRAKIAGSRSFGKGSVQNVIPYDGGEMKLTIASFWRPSGKNLDKRSTKGKDEDEWGVTPDKELTLVLPRTEEDDLLEALHAQEVIGRPEKEGKPFKDRQLEMALKFLRK